MKFESVTNRGRGRPLQFDPDQAIESAMRVFWLKGYEGTSLNDLTEAMGINKPSLYAQFGDKRGLFIAALDHYQSTVASQHVTPLLTATTTRDAIIGYFSSINESLAATGSPPGCLVGTVATDLAGRDPEIREMIAMLVATAEIFLAERFKKLGGAPMDEGILAELVVSIGQSLAARARLGASVEDLNGITERFLTATFDKTDKVPPD